MEMMPFAERTFQIYELTQRILLELNDPVEIIRAQRVCRTWKNVIQTSPALQHACWYRPDSARDAHVAQQKRSWILNPVFKRMGISITQNKNKKASLAGRYEEKGNFNLEKRMYDKPGSWTTMLATEPPCQRMVIECYGDYSADETMWYLISSIADPLLMGDVMAVLAECQNRQEYGLDRWEGCRHYTGRICRFSNEKGCAISDWLTLDKMPNDVSINVAVVIPWGGPECTAFSLRRVSGTREFLHEMVVHKMVTEYGGEYRWDYLTDGGDFKDSLCKGEEEYRANLLVVKEHQKGYLSDCRKSFRLLTEMT